MKSKSELRRHAQGNPEALVKRIEEVEAEARFLLDRLDELSFDDIDGVSRDYYGHVIPSIERLRIMLDRKKGEPFDPPS